MSYKNLNSGTFFIGNKFDRFFIKKGQWHQITNPFEETCHLIEIQYGDECVEEDIERIDKS